MDINKLFEGISDFWNNIYPIILVSILFFFIYSFVFGKVQLKEKLIRYSKSEQFISFKDLLTQFGLWKSFPLIIGVTIIIYFAVFNSLVDISGNFRINLFNITYSDATLIEEMMLKNRFQSEISTIAAYNRKAEVNIWDVAEVVRIHSEYYRERFPDDYNNSISWTFRKAGKYDRYLAITSFFIYALLILLFINIVRPKRKRFVIIMRFALILLVAFVSCSFFRIMEEHVIEERVKNNLVFVASHLITDTSQTPATPDKMEAIKKNFQTFRMNQANYKRQWYFWMSRYFEGNRIVEFFVGIRPLNQ